MLIVHLQRVNTSQALSLYDKRLRFQFDLRAVSYNRNQLAHGGPIPQNIAQELRDTIIGRRNKPGICIG
jgi:hypothetical protein